MPSSPKWLVLVAAFVLAMACGEEKAAQGPTSGVAGKVLELSGEVKAERGGETRALVVGGEVFAKDTVITGADGTVTILLNHNNAKWSLGSGEKQQIRASLAWKAKPEKGGAFGGKGDDTTVTAGRNVENETASTSGTMSADMPEELEEEADGFAAEKREVAPAADAPAATGGPPGGAPRVRRAKEKRKPAPNKAPVAESTGGLGMRGSGVGGGGTGEGTIGKGNVGLIGKGAGGGSGSGYGRGSATRGGRSAKGAQVRHTAPKVTPADALSKDIIRRVVRRHVGEVKYCYERELKRNPNAREGRVVLSFTIDGQGRVVRATFKADRHFENVGKCAASKARRWRFPKPKNGAKVKVDYPFVFRVSN